jgi:hypothetical protein
MDLRSRYIRKFARVPLHLNYKLLVWNNVQGAAAISEENLRRCCEPGNENIVGNFALICCPGGLLRIHTKTDLHWLKCGGRSSLGES